MAIVYLGLGSNLGNRLKNIKNAVSCLRQNKIKVAKLSTIIETDPVGGPKNQPKFLNAVLKGQTNLTPTYLVKTVKSIEQKMGRIRTSKNGPRLIDIDILIYGNKKIRSKKLTVPHPRMHTRDFVMQPLTEIAPLIAKRILRCAL